MAVLQPNRERKLKLQELNPFITCKLCSGYLIKPTTITECLHTFCRSCIVKYLQDNDDNQCPICAILIHETNPFDMLRSDQTLEDVIYKLVPNLQEDEQKREIHFIKEHKSDNEKQTNEENKENNTAIPDSTTEEPAGKRLKLSADDYDSKENFHRDDPQIGVCLECLNDNSLHDPPVRELVRKYIRCSSRLTIAQVKKFLKVKLNLKTADQVEVMCNGEIMGKDHTLEFVYMTRWRIKVRASIDTSHVAEWATMEGSVLTLQYRPRMDFF